MYVIYENIKFSICMPMLYIIDISYRKMVTVCLPILSYNRHTKCNLSLYVTLFFAQHTKFMSTTQFYIKNYTQKKIFCCESQRNPTQFIIPLSSLSNYLKQQPPSLKIIVEYQGWIIHHRQFTGSDTRQTNFCSRHLPR